MSSRPHNSLIATFDLLGISALIGVDSSNTLPNLANELRSIFHEVSSTLDKILAEYENSSEDLTCAMIIGKIRSGIRFHNFSDTIIASLNLDLKYIYQIPPLDQHEQNVQNGAISIFMKLVSFMAYALFSKGVPARGCVDIGTVFWDKDLVLGKPYVRALKTAETLEFSGVTITDEAFAFLEKHHDGELAHAVSYSMIDLKVPTKLTKNGNLQNMHCLNWVNDTKAEDFIGLSFDIKQKLFEKFSALGKTVSGNVWEKLENTENTLRAFFRQNEYEQLK